MQNNIVANVHIYYRKFVIQKLNGIKMNREFPRQNTLSSKEKQSMYKYNVRNTMYNRSNPSTTITSLLLLDLKNEKQKMKNKK